MPEPEDDGLRVIVELAFKDHAEEPFVRSVTSDLYKIIEALCECNELGSDGCTLDTYSLLVFDSEGYELDW